MIIEVTLFFSKLQLLCRGFFFVWHHVDRADEESEDKEKVGCDLEPDDEVRQQNKEKQRCILPTLIDTGLSCFTHEYRECGQSYYSEIEYEAEITYVSSFIETTPILVNVCIRPI